MFDKRAGSNNAQKSIGSLATVEGQEFIVKISNKPYKTLSARALDIGRAPRLLGNLQVNFSPVQLNKSFPGVYGWPTDIGKIYSE